MRSALESHLATKHVAQYSKGDINIDTLPDAATSEDSGLMSGRSTLFPSVPVPTSPPGSIPMPASEKPSDFETSMRKYYEDTMKQFINDVNKGRSEETADTAGSKTAKSEAALDLSSPPLKPSATNITEATALPPGSEADSQIYEFEDDPGLDMENYPMEISSNDHQDPKKRCRTQMTPVQVRLMKHLFHVHKTPSMAECLALSQLIGLPKRVIQVWFQNARSKDKKARLSFMETQGKEYEERRPEMIKMFGLEKISTQCDLIERMLTREHLERVRAAMERGEYSPPSPGDLDSVAVDSASNSVTPSHNSSSGREAPVSQAGHKESYGQPPEYQESRSGYTNTFPTTTSSSSYPSFPAGSGSTLSPVSSGYHGGVSGPSYSEQYNHSHGSHYPGYQGHSYQTEYHR